MRRRLLTALLAAAGALALAPAVASAATVDVRAVGNSGPGSVWDPDTVEVEVGDTVRWLFDSADTNQVHNVRLHPGAGTGNPAVLESPLIVSPTSPATVYDYTFSETGLYTYVCSLHPSTMTGTVTVGDAPDDAEPPTTTVSLDPPAPGPDGWYEGPVEVELSATDGEDGTGVAETEYRINGGDWTTFENTENEDPFVNSFVVSDDGSYSIAYRSRDAAGNQEATKYVSFQIGEPVSEPGVWDIFARDDGTSPVNYWDPNLVGEATLGDKARFLFTAASAPHNVWIKPPDDAPFELAAIKMPNDEAVEFEPDSQGMWAYYCTLHGGSPTGIGGMSGRFYVDTEPDDIVEPWPNPEQPPTDFEEGDNDPPVLSKVKAKGLKGGVRLRLRLSEPGKVKVRFVHLGKKNRVVKTASKKVKQGANKFRIKDRKRLVGGKYRLILRAADAAGNKAAPKRIRVKLKY